jgi:CubicO group peptidase (beta-lactamase class C family)
MDSNAIDELLEDAVGNGALPGVIAVAGDRDGTLYEGAFGRLSVDGEEPVRADTMLAIMSMTKAVTSVAALQLIEQGRLELEQSVCSVLPAFGELQVLEGFDGDTPRLRAPASQASIRQLLTHTSGLAYAFGNADLLRYYRLCGINPLALGRAMLDGVPLIADPGTRWEYGTSTDWLGRLVEALSGQDLGAYCKQHIFAPLGMTDTTFSPSEEQRARMMELHARAPDGGLARSPFESSIEPGFFSGGGGAYSTAGDYLRFLRALLCGGELDGERILRPETVELAFSDHLAGAPLPEIMRSAMPELTNDVPSLPVRQGWGLGFNLLLEDIPGMRRAGTGSWAGLFNCYYWIDHATGVTAALLTQVLPFFDARIVQTMLAFNGAVFSAVDDDASI